MSRRPAYYRRKRIFTALTVVLVIVIALLAALLIFRGAARPAVINPDYPPQETEANAQRIPGEQDTEKLSAQKGGEAVSLQFSSKITLDLSDEEVLQRRNSLRWISAGTT